MSTGRPQKKQISDQHRCVSPGTATLIFNMAFSRGAAHGSFGNDLDTNLSSGQPPTGEHPITPAGVRTNKEHG